MKDHVHSTCKRNMIKRSDTPNTESEPSETPRQSEQIYKTGLSIQSYQIELTEPLFKVLYGSYKTARFLYKIVVVIVYISGKD